RDAPRPWRTTTSATALRRCSRPWSPPRPIGDRARAWRGDRGVHAAPPRQGVPALPQEDRQAGGQAPQCARRMRQLLDPQDQAGGGLAEPTQALQSALHADLGVFKSVAELEAAIEAYAYAVSSG